MSESPDYAAQARTAAAALRSIVEQKKLDVQNYVAQAKIQRAQALANALNNLPGILQATPGLLVSPGGTTTTGGGSTAPPTAATPQITVQGTASPITVATGVDVLYKITGQDQDHVKVIYMDQPTVQSSKTVFSPKRGTGQILGGFWATDDVLGTGPGTPFTFYVTVQDTDSGVYGNVVTVTITPPAIGHGLTSGGGTVTTPGQKGTLGTSTPGVQGSNQPTAAAPTLLTTSLPGTIGTIIGPGSFSTGDTSAIPSPVVVPPLPTVVVPTTTTTTVNPLVQGLPATITATFQDGSSVQGSLVDPATASAYLGGGGSVGLEALWDIGTGRDGSKISSVSDGTGSVQSWGSITGGAQQTGGFQVPIGRTFVTIPAARYGTPYNPSYLPSKSTLNPVLTAPTGATTGIWYAVNSPPPGKNFQTSNRQMAYDYIHIYGGSVQASQGQWPGLQVANA